MANFKDRQIIHIKEVFRDQERPSHASPTANSYCLYCREESTEERSHLLHNNIHGSVQAANDVLGHMNGTMTSGEQTQSGSIYDVEKKPGYKKKRPAPRPPETGQSSTSGGDDSKVNAVQKSSAVVSGTRGETNTPRPSLVKQLSPIHTTGNRPGRPYTEEHSSNNQGELFQTRSVLNSSSTVVKGNTSMSLLDKENRGLHRTSSPEEGIYAAGSVCQSDTGTIASSGYQSDIMKDTGNSLDIEADEFEEGGFTVEFDDEDEGVGHHVESKHTHVYKEFEGEDFSQYLEDDAVDLPEPVAPPRGGRKGGRAPLPPPSNPAVPVPGEDRTLTKKNGLKQKFSKVFTMSRSQNKNARSQRPQTQQQNNSIHSFTFSDSKLGNQATDSKISDPGYRKSQAFDNENFGGGGTHWWNTGTLSARREKNVMAKRSSSVPNMLDEDDFFNPQGRKGKGASSVYSENLTSSSNRKSGIYESKGGSQTKKSNIWKKFTRTLRKEQRPDPYGEDSVSTVSVKQRSTSYSPEYQDVRL